MKNHGTDAADRRLMVEIAKALREAGHDVPADCDDQTELRRHLQTALRPRLPRRHTAPIRKLLAQLVPLVSKERDAVLAADAARTRPNVALDATREAINVRRSIERLENDIVHQVHEAFYGVVSFSPVRSVRPTREHLIKFVERLLEQDARGEVPDVNNGL